MIIRKPLLPFVISVVICCAVVTNAQINITLREALEYGAENSYAIKAAKLTLQSSEKNLEAIERGLMTSINLELDAPRYSRSLKSQFNTTTGAEEFYQIGNTIIESRLSFNQPIIFSNGTLSLEGSLFGRDQFTNTAGTKRDYFSNVSVRLRQPLFGFNSLRASREKAKLNLERARRNFSRSEADLRYAVSAAFYELYKTQKEVDITAEKVRQTEAAFITARNKFRAGLLAEVEALQLEVDLSAAKNELLNVETSLKEDANTFKITAGYSLGLDVRAVGEFDETLVTIRLDTALNGALANRAEIKNAETDIEFSRLSVEETNAKGRITGLVNASYGINKNDLSFGGVFDRFLDDRGVSFTLSLPVWDWGKNSAEIQAVEANLKNAELSAVNQRELVKKEIQAAFNKYEAAIARMQVLSKSVEIAEKSYAISLSRFEAGTITSFDLSQLQIRLTDAKLRQLTARIDYLLAVADMERKTLRRFTKE